MSSRNVRKLISVGLLVILAIIFAATTESFFNSRNIILLLRESSYVGLIALGMAFVIIGGGIDLSAGGIVCLSAVVCSRLAATNDVPAIFVILAGILTGMVCGAINALINNKLHLTEFVATLASGFVYTGLALIVAYRENGRLVTQAVKNKGFLLLGDKIFGIHIMTLTLIVLMIVLMIILYKTRFGLHTYAQGSNAKSAQMSGVNNAMIKASGFIICGFFCGLAATFTLAYQGAVSLATGTGMEFQAIAACVVGGVVLGGGQGDALGAFVGALFLTLIMNGLYKYGIPTAYQYILQGGIILLATSFDAQFNKFTERRLSAASTGSST